MDRIWAAVLTALALVAQPLPLHAQVVMVPKSPGPDFRLSAVQFTLGLVNPEYASNGVVAGLDVGLGTVLTRWIHLSSGVNFWSTDIDRASLGSAARGTVSDLSLRSDVRVRGPSIRRIRPYLLTGLGFHSVSASIENDPNLQNALSGVQLGADLGVGIRTAPVGFGWGAEFRRSFVSDVDHWSLTAGLGWSFAGPKAGPLHSVPDLQPQITTLRVAPSTQEIAQLSALVNSVLEENRRLKNELSTARPNVVASAVAAAPVAPIASASPARVDRGTLPADLHRAVLDIALAEGDPLSFAVTDEGYRLTLSGALLFAVGSSEVNAAASETLRLVSRTLLRYPDVTLQVDGHADASGRADRNLILSESRAKSVQRELNQFGVATDRVAARGFGSSNPIADNDTPQGRERNRRVELLFRLLDRPSDPRR